MAKKFLQRRARNGKPFPLPVAKINADNLPPHSVEAEEGALACIFAAAELERGREESERMMAELRTELFYDLRFKTLHNWIAEILMEGIHTLHLSSFVAAMKAKGRKWGDIGDLAALTALPGKVASPFQFAEFLHILKQMHRRRFLLRESARLAEDANNAEVSLEDIIQRFDELSERTGRGQKKPLKIWRVNDLLKYKPPTHLRLVGDNEICMGYEGLALVAGPGSSGKSLTVSSLAIAGAIGSGTWMGRAVHRKFRTMIFQAENGSIRLKAEIEAMAKLHPGLNIHDHIFISEPPEGGLPFHNSDFRTAVRHEVAQLKPDLIVLDPWSQVAAEDAAKEVVDKLGEIRSCFPAGETCPGLLIVAHTKKPRPEDVRRGRGLANLVSGSIALVNTARTVYVLLPWSDELEDDRIYWSCPKLNNGQMYGASVWKRRFGTFFEHDTETDPKTWGEEKRKVEESRAVTENDVEMVYGGMGVGTLKKSDLAKRLEKACGVGYSTVMRAITPGRGGYLSEMFKVDKNGWLELKKEGK